MNISRSTVALLSPPRGRDAIDGILHRNWLLGLQIEFASDFPIQLMNEPQQRDYYVVLPQSLQTPGCAAVHRDRLVGGNVVQVESRHIILFSRYALHCRRESLGQKNTRHQFEGVRSAMLR